MGGVVLPVLLLGGVLTNSLRVLPDFLTPAPEGSLRLRVVGYQYWWPVQYPDGAGGIVERHGPADHPRNPAYASLAGQYADYVVPQLELFRARARGGSAFSPLMHNVVDGLEPQQTRDAAAYYAALEPDAVPGR